MRFLSLVLMNILFISCGGDDFDARSKLNNLRILALTANTPEINSTSTVIITPLISYLNGAGATLNYQWEACPDPGIEYGAKLNCDSLISSLKTTGNGTFDTSTLIASYYTGNAVDISITVPTSVFTYLGTLSSDIQYNGLNYIVFLTYTNPSNGDSIQSLKRIKLSTKAVGELNTNPNFTDIQLNNSTLSSYPTSKGRIGISSPSSAQSYTIQTNVGQKTFQEEMYISWYSSTGEFKFNRTDPGEENEFIPSGSTGVFIAVYRDGRGGISTYQISF